MYRRVKCASLDRYRVEVKDRGFEPSLDLEQMSSILNLRFIVPLEENVFDNDEDLSERWINTVKENGSCLIYAINLESSECFEMDCDSKSFWDFQLSNHVPCANMYLYIDDKCTVAICFTKEDYDLCLANELSILAIFGKTPSECLSDFSTYMDLEAYSKEPYHSRLVKVFEAAKKHNKA